MAATEAGTAAGEIMGLAGLVVRDAEKLLSQHARLIRSETAQGLRRCPPRSRRSAPVRGSPRPASASAC